MARAKKEVVVEQVEEPEVPDTEEFDDTDDESEIEEDGEELTEEDGEELTEEEQLLKDALDDDANLEVLSALVGADGVSDRLNTMITTFLALYKALGAEATATKHAFTNLTEYKPEKIKQKRAAAEKKFNEVSELKKAMAAENVIEALNALLADERITEGLNVAITTYVTLVGVEGLPEPVLHSARDTLASFGRKGGIKRSGTPLGPRVVTFHIGTHYIGDGEDTTNDKSFTTLCGALDGVGIHKSDETNVGTEEAPKLKNAQDVAWRYIRPRLLKGEQVEYGGVLFSQVPVSAESITGEKPGRKPKAETESEEVEEAAEATYE